MRPSALPDQKAAARGVVVQESVDGNALVPPGVHQRNTISTIRSAGPYGLESASENGLYEPPDASLLPVTRVDVTKLIGALRHLEVMAKRPSPRIACKANGRIFFSI